MISTDLPVGFCHGICCICPGLYEGFGMWLRGNHCPSRQAAAESIGQRGCPSHQRQGHTGSRGQKDTLQTTSVVFPLLAASPGAAVVAIVHLVIKVHGQILKEAFTNLIPCTVLAE